MRKLAQTLTLLFIIAVTSVSEAQNWLTTGNSGLNNSSFLGTTDNKDLFFKTNKIQYGRLTNKGQWRLGTASNYLKIDSNGSIAFVGNGGYQVNGNAYAFQWIGNSNIGLFFSSSSSRYEFRNPTAGQAFYCTADGVGYFSSKLSLGTTTVPSGALLANGIVESSSGGFKFPDATIQTTAFTPYVAGAGINVTGNTITNTSPTQWTTSGSNINYSSGKVAIGTSSPSEKLHVADGNLLVTGTFGSSSPISVTGAGTRMFFDPNKAAFRAGNVGGNNWDNINIGNYSAAVGNNTTASGIGSISFGSGATASGDYSIALGNSSTAGGNSSFCSGTSGLASGAYAIAMGNFPDAEGDNSISMGNTNSAFANNSIAIGNQNFATNESSIAFGKGNFAFADYSAAIGFTNETDGVQSIALGSNLSAPSYAEITVGINNTTYNPSSSATWNSADRIFTVGNGANSGSKSDALTVLKSGNVGVGTSSPLAKLHIFNSSGSAALRIESGSGDATMRLVASGSGKEASTSLNTSGSQRWSFGKSNTVESGSNAGSDFFVNRFDDSGNFLSQPIVIKRSTGNVGIGTASPSQALEVNGTAKTSNLQITSGATSGYVLQSDVLGNATWVNPASLFTDQWSTSGSNIYNTNTGNIGIGTSSPSQKLDVSGTTKTTKFQMTSGATDGYAVMSDSSGNASWVNPSELFIKPVFSTSNQGSQTIAAGTSNVIPFSVVFTNGGQVTSHMKISFTFNITCSSMSNTHIQIAGQLATVVLYDKEVSGSNFVNTTFSSTATADITSASAPYTGSFTATGSLSDFIGESYGNGTMWYGAIFSDQTNGTGLTLNSWSMNIEENTIGDDLGNHTAYKDVKLNGYWLSNDGHDEGLHIDDGGSIFTSNGIGVGTNSIVNKLDVEGNFAVGASYSGSVAAPVNGAIIEGNLGIGTTSPSHKLQLGSDDAAKPSTSTWTVTSDQRLKTDVHAFTDGWNVLKDVNPVWFTYNGEGGTTKGETSMGTIAQDLEKVAPYMVSHWTYHAEKGSGTDYLGVNYHALFFLLANEAKAEHRKVDSLAGLIADLQSSTGLHGDEQAQIISEQQDQITALSSKLDEVSNKMQQMENSLSQCCTAYQSSDPYQTSNLKLQTPVLEQNVPNPFTQTSYIKFYIPSTSKNAIIIVSDVNGTTVKQFSNLSVGFGTVNIGAGMLASGTYMYTLSVDGKLIDTKQMVLTQ